ncbi:hypothetical protein IAT38_000807 [Cryptococcus sp. DSM 104549]
MSTTPTVPPVSLPLPAPPLTRNAYAYSRTSRASRPNTPTPSSTQTQQTTLPSPPTSLSPTTRLLNLLATISSLLAAYSALPSASPIYIASLEMFHSRAASILPPSEALEFNTPSPSPSPTRTTTTTTATKRTRNPLSPPDTQDRSPPKAEQVESLEREWWQSEVVAAWYGPRPRPGPVVVASSPGTGGRGKALLPDRGGLGGMGNGGLGGMGGLGKQLARQGSGAVLPQPHPQPLDQPQYGQAQKHHPPSRRGSPALGEQRATRASTVGGGTAATMKERYESEPAVIRRDSSYVGLHDE